MEKYRSFFILVGIVLSFITTTKVFADVQWPPRLGHAFPDDITYIDQEGESIKLSDFKGSVFLVEYVGMNCPACQAFSGANKKSIGPFENNAVQQGLDSLEKYCPLYAQGISLDDKRFIFIQVLLYDRMMRAPKSNDAKRWAEHFRYKKENLQYVLVPDRDMRSPASYNLIPGFQLIDKNFIVRSDSTGHHPNDNLYLTLLPMLSKLLDE